MPMGYRPKRRFAPLLPTVVAVLLGSSAPGPSLATALGNPSMHVLVAKILPPYSPNYDLSTAVSAWPPLGDVTFLRQDQKVNGQIRVDRTYSTTPATLRNQGTALANDWRTFLSTAEARNPHTYQDHVGVFSYTQWAQSFRKDSPTAVFQYTISGARVYAMCLTTGSRAEFAADVLALHEGAPIHQFHQDAGVVLAGNPPNVPLVFHTAHGPMVSAGSNPDGIQRDYLLDFSGTTQTVDLSSVPVGGEFSVVFNEMTQANIAFDEVVRAYAYFRDPGSDSTGVVFELSGLTPTDAPQIPTVAVIPSPPGPVARLSAPWPNPGRDPIALSLELPRAGAATVEVLDVTGRIVSRLADGPFAAGTHLLRWDGSDARGDRAPAGVYFVRASGPGLSLTRRIVRLDGR